jgi:hypothetical protein
MRTQFLSRKLAADYYHARRRWWTREAAWYLTVTACAVPGTRKLAATLACLQFNIFLQDEPE